MGRRKKRRIVQEQPGALFYKPQGVPMRLLEVVKLSFEELEALRLADKDDLSHQESADHMGVSRATFGRILAQARTTVASALTEGRAIRIEGGHYTLAAKEQQCQREDADEVKKQNKEGLCLKETI